MIEIRKFIIDTILLSRDHIQILQLAPKMPLIANPPTPAAKSRIQSWITHCILLSHLFSLPYLEQLLLNLSFVWPWHFSRAQASYLCRNICQFGFIWHFLMMRLCGFFAISITKMMLYPFESMITWGTWCWFLTISVICILIID